MVAAAAGFLSEHYGAPVMLFALLLGMAMGFLATEGQCKPGIEFTARSVLRVGVDGTDREINAAEYGAPPAGSDSRSPSVSRAPQTP